MSQCEEITSTMLQKNLDERVAKAGGDIQTVEQGLHTDLRELESTAKDADSSSRVRQDIALVLTAIKYLEQFHEAKEGAPAVSPHSSVMNRMRHAFNK